MAKWTSGHYGHSQAMKQGEPHDGAIPAVWTTGMPLTPAQMCGKISNTNLDRGAQFDDQVDDGAG